MVQVCRGSAHCLTSWQSLQKGLFFLVLLDCQCAISGAWTSAGNLIPRKFSLKASDSTDLDISSLNQVPEGQFSSYNARFLDDNGLTIVQGDDGRVTAQPNEKHNFDSNSESQSRKQVNAANTLSQRYMRPVKEQPAQIVPASGFNVVLTHCTADFDSLASAVGLAKLWSHQDEGLDPSSPPTSSSSYKVFDSPSHVPTFVVLPRGAHPAVQKFLNLHKHLFPIRSLRSLPTDLSGLNRLGLVDAQRRDRIGPAEHLLGLAKRITVVDHHVDADSDIPEATDYVVDKVGSVSTLMCERLKEAVIPLTQAESTLLALGIHADTGSLCYDSTTPRDASALAWLLEMGASQMAIAEHARTSLSPEQQAVLTKALMNINSTTVYGVTVSTVLLRADGFINGLATVTKDALELSSSDIFLLGLVYEPRSGGSKKSKRGPPKLAAATLFEDDENTHVKDTSLKSWTGSDDTIRQRRLKAAFERRDVDNSGYLESREIAAALSTSGTVLTGDAVADILEQYDIDDDGKIDFKEFLSFASDAEKWQADREKKMGRKASTLIIIGRSKAGVNLKSVRLNTLMEGFGGGGHPKAASATVRLADDSEAEAIMQGMVDDLIELCLTKQPCVGDFMTSPVLSAQPHMTEKQVEDLFVRYDVRALPVVDSSNNVIGLVTYKDVAAAKQRLWNKEQKRLRQDAERAALKDADQNRVLAPENKKVSGDRKLGSALKGWMKQHVTTIPASMTMAEVEQVLLENDVGCVPVVQDGTKKLVGMVTRTDLLRQHRYYPSLHYHNKGFSNSIAARKPIIELRKKLKQFDLDD
jgi:nanoRNase/pAp phosphatase (c-di-AMP/oligoRNAs hydrolase)